MDSTRPLAALCRLAGRYDVQVSYRNVRTGRLVAASPDSLLGALRALGAPIDRVEDAPDVLRRQDRISGARVAGPSAVAWDGIAPSIPLRLPGNRSRFPVRFHWEMEGGEHVILESRGTPRKVRCPRQVPAGVHRVRIEWSGGSHTMHVISAPRRIRRTAPDRKKWGVFLPLYAARSEGDWGVGSLTHLEDLVRWTSDRGGSLVSTLPLFATYLDVPFDPSPYAPVTRLFWNECYLDPTAMEEFSSCAEAKRIASSSLRGFDAGHGDRHVDWRNVMRLKRRVLREMCRDFYRREGTGSGDFLAYSREEPELESYARFRAGRGDDSGPAASDAWPDPDRVRYHKWVQWRFERSLSRIAEDGRRRGTGLYLDLPLGVRGDGYDPWRWPGIFARGASGGAPPDHYSVRGQDWGFPPLHPMKIREDGHAYFRACLRRLSRHATFLRLDHVMSLHRLWWVPDGAEPSEGVYVRYPAEELYAVACLEASRAGVTLVGEDLGTVPAEVRPALRRHGILGCWAVQRVLSSDPEHAFSGTPPGTAASFNTHDHPTFAGWWSESDLEDRVRLGFLDSEGLKNERVRRARGRRALQRSVRSHRVRTGQGAGPRFWYRMSLPILGRSRAEVVLVNLEDVWGERRPQNVPGTTHERSNWCRRAGRTIRQIEESTVIRDALSALDAARREKEVL